MKSTIHPNESWYKVIKSSEGNRALHASVAFQPGEIITGFRISRLLPNPTRHSIQYNASKHMLIAPEFLRLTNHSCDPNITIHTRDLYVKAVRPIEPGDELVYFYPSTEWSMAEPFQCCCESPRCLIHIRGAAYLPMHVLAGYYLNDHIKALIGNQREISAPRPYRGPQVGTEP